ncbi:hypothetical protein AGMMS50276_29480 [Synergistales bacterium]|nr:hypothetical protein AGMMS50276_29480 [Synergistales bacterium]
MPTPPVAERGITTERAQARGTFTDNLIPESTFKSEYAAREKFETRIEKTLDRIEAKIDKVETNLNARIDKLEVKIERVETKVESIRTELNARIDSVRTDLKADIKDARDDSKNDSKTTNARIDKVEAQLWGILSTVIISIIAQIVLRYL